MSEYMSKADAAWSLFFGLVIAFLLDSLQGCNPAALSTVKCKAEAAELLPDDPGAVTVSHAIEVVEAVRRCSRDADAGAK
jgi:hypothetical protein